MPPRSFELSKLSIGFQPARPRVAIGRSRRREERLRHAQVIACGAGSGPFAQALQQIGNALDSNDLDGAQHGDTEVTAIVDSTNKVDITT